MIMSDIVIRAEGLSKSYLIGHQQSPERYHAFRDVIAQSARNVARGALNLWRGHELVHGDSFEEFWALSDVNFDIRKADVVGIIGRNGAGKSTLLKILSRITEPSRGRVTIHGRIASLLEVGTGFHSELTGRENIYLNGAILGLTRSEIRSKFDEIVEFAEIDRFLDTPVKRYSSGMYVRLAFAVAAHLEADILIVDEVLAVGDASFQAKCLKKMKEVSHGEGRTVIFVTHDMAAMRALCKKGILLEQGRVVRLGSSDDIVQHYFNASGMNGQNGIIPDDLPRLYSTGSAKLRVVRLEDAQQRPVQSAITGEPLRIVIEWEVFRPTPTSILEIGVMDEDGRQITQSMSNHGLPSDLVWGVGLHKVRLTINEDFVPGDYSLLAGIHEADGTTIDWVQRAFSFKILNAGKDSAKHCDHTVRGYLRPHQSWQYVNPDALD
jgi:lipopolysaccharide transport system ATP-binding protein